MQTNSLKTNILHLKDKHITLSEVLNKWNIKNEKQIEIFKHFWKIINTNYDNPIKSQEIRNLDLCISDTTIYQYILIIRKELERFYFENHGENL